MLSGERMIVRQWARYWWVFLVSGILWLLVAWVVLRGNQTSIAAVGVLGYARIGLGTIIFLAALLFAPKHGLLSARRASARL